MLLYDTRKLLMDIFRTFVYIKLSRDKDAMFYREKYHEYFIYVDVCKIQMIQ